MATVPMFSPDGTVGDIPHERVADAVKAGFKVGQDMIAPDGSQGTIPIDKVPDAMKAGFASTPLASAARSEQPEFANPLPTEKIPGAGLMMQPLGEIGANLAYDPAFRKETAEYGAGSAAAVGATAAAPQAIASTAATGLPFLRQEAAKHPLITKAVASEGISLARRIPFLGKLMPSYAEMLPWMKGGS
jgi:hypothetical protein